MAAKRTKKDEALAPAHQQKATPVEPPSAREVASPVTFFNDPRMRQKAAGVKDFAPHPTTNESAGNDSSPSPEGDG